MKAALRGAALPPERNIFLYYAIGKELEDLKRWDEAFHYYRLAGMPMFIGKSPEDFLFLSFIAKAFPSPASSACGATR